MCIRDRNKLIPEPQPINVRWGYEGKYSRQLLMMTASQMVDHECSGGRNLLTLISRLHLNESSPNLDVYRRICSERGRGITFTKRQDRPASSNASIGRNGRRSEHASCECVTEKARRLRAVWLCRWAGESARARAAQIHVHKRKERSDSVKRAATCLLYTSPSPRDRTRSRMPSSA